MNYGYERIISRMEKKVKGERILFEVMEELVRAANNQGLEGKELRRFIVDHDRDFIPGDQCDRIRMIFE